MLKRIPYNLWRNRYRSLPADQFDQESQTILVDMPESLAEHIDNGDYNALRELYINDRCVGLVKSQRRSGGPCDGWSFLMDGGYYVKVDCSNIKSFTSCGPLEIITYG